MLLLLLFIIINVTKGFYPDNYLSTLYSNNLSPSSSSTTSRVRNILNNNNNNVNHFDAPKLATNGKPIANQGSEICVKLENTYYWMKHCIFEDATVWGNGPNAGDWTFKNVGNCLNQAITFKLTNKYYETSIKAAERGQVGYYNGPRLIGGIESCKDKPCVIKKLRHSFLLMCGFRDSLGTNIPVPGLKPAGEEPPPPVRAPGSLEGYNKEKIDSIVCKTLDDTYEKFNKCNKEGKWKKSSEFMKCFQNINTKLPVWKLIFKRAKYMKEKNINNIKYTNFNDVAKCFADCYANRTDNPSWFGRMTGVGVRLDSCNTIDCTKISFISVCKNNKAWKPANGWPTSS